MPQARRGQTSQVVRKSPRASAARISSQDMWALVVMHPGGLRRGVDGPPRHAAAGSREMDLRGWEHAHLGRAEHRARGDTAAAATGAGLSYRLQLGAPRGAITGHNYPW